MLAVSYGTSVQKLKSTYNINRVWLWIVFAMLS